MDHRVVVPQFVEHIAHQSFQHTSTFPKAISSCTAVFPKPPQQLVVVHTQERGVACKEEVVVQHMAHTLDLVAGMLVLVVVPMAHTQELVGRHMVEVQSKGHKG